jgi:hypothetical protein
MQTALSWCPEIPPGLHPRAKSAIIRFEMTKKEMKNNFKGNKQYLPSKPCKTCGREMTWRKHWAKNWEEVQYCSNACRQGKAHST